MVVIPLGPRGHVLESGIWRRAGIKEKRRRGDRGRDGWMDMSLSKLWETVMDGEARYSAVHGVTESDTTECFPGGANGKEPTCQCRRHRRRRFDPWVGKIPRRRALQPTPVFLPGEFHGQRSLSNYNPWSCKESDMT